MKLLDLVFFLFHRSLTVYKCRSPGAASPFTPEELSISSFNIFISRTKFFFLSPKSNFL